MEAESSLVGPDCTVVLNAVAFVYLKMPAVVNPGNPEGNNTFRFNQALQQRCIPVFLSSESITSLRESRISFYSLVEFIFTGVIFHGFTVNFIDIRHNLSSSYSHAPLKSITGPFGIADIPDCVPIASIVVLYHGKVKKHFTGS